MRMYFLWVLGILIFTALSADVITDGTMGSSSTFSGSNINIGSEFGRSSGANLFHSFSDFNINLNQTVSFSSPSSINNIIARVTGNSASIFAGSLLADSNLYFF